jgi:lipopolysaccharide biosynthesis glycosyltransferase
MDTVRERLEDAIHIAFAVDKNYLNQVAVTIASIVANSSTPDALRFYLVHDEEEAWVSEQVSKWSVVRPQQIRVRNPFHEHRGGAGSSWTTATFLRILLPSALSHIDRVLYLDPDIVVTHDVLQLWRTDIGRASVAGVVDMGIALFLGRGEVYKSFATRDHLFALGLDPERTNYINTGVLLMNLSNLRNANFLEFALEMDGACRKNLTYLDQDIINSVLSDSVFLLDPRWNVMCSVMIAPFVRRHHYIQEKFIEELKLQKAEQWLIHYNGLNKPWNSDSAWLGEVWWHYAGLTGIDWPRPPATRRSLVYDIREGWLNVASKFSALRHKLRGTRLGKVRNGGN